MTRIPQENVHQRLQTGDPQTDRSSILVRAISLFGVVAVLSAILVARWWFGGVEAQVQVWLFAAVLIALVCSVVVLAADRQLSLRLPWAVLPLGAAILLGAFQLIPLDSSTRDAISPAAADGSSRLIGDADGKLEAWAEDLGVSAEPERRPLSLYAASTRHDLSLLVLGVSVFFLGVVFFASPKANLWLCGLVVANGAALTFFGLTQRLSWNGLLYWSVPLTQGGLPFGPFVNRNNAGGYLILCFSAGVGATLWCLQRYLPTRRRGESWEIHGFSLWWSSLKRRVLSLVAELNARTLGALTATGFIAAGILATLSRGASVAAIVATLVTVAVVRISNRRGPSMVWLLLVIVIGLGLVSWVGIGDAVEGQVTTLFGNDVRSHARFPHWKNGMQAASDFWFVGSGLGTYRFVYPKYQHRFQEKWFYHAENQYLEALVEGGMVGLSLLLLVLVLIVAGTWRLLRWDPDPRSAVFAVAGILAVTGQALAACFDFGLYIPANMLLFALICGALAGRAAGVGRGGSEIVGTTKLQRCMAVTLALILLGAGFWGCRQLQAASDVEEALKQVRLSGALTKFVPEEIEPQIKVLGEVAAIHADNPELHRRLAELWIQLYRAHTFKIVQSKTTFAEDDPRLLQLTMPLVLHQRIHFLQKYQLTDELAKLRSAKAAQENLLPALKHLVLSRRHCALLPEVHNGLAQLCGIVSDPADDLSYLERMRLLAPSNPDLLYAAGLMEHHAGRVDLALECWKQCLTLSDRYLDNVLDLGDPWLINPDAIKGLFPDSPSMLVKLARERYAEDSRTEVPLLLVDRASQLIDQVDLAEADRFYLTAAICAMRSEFDEAFKNYASAIRKRPDAFKWRYEFALLLQKQGQLDKAYEQAQWCTKLAPRYRIHHQLLEKIRHDRMTLDVGSKDD